jgi:DNA-binding NarL/FixJ family response regulator
MEHLLTNDREAPQMGVSLPRVVVLSDHPIARHGMRVLLEDRDDVEWVGDADCSAAGLAVVDGARADLVVVDIAQPIRETLAWVRCLRSRYTDLRILTMSAQPAWVLGVRALRAGANGFVHKSESLSELMLAIKLTAQGHGYIAQSALSRLVTPSQATTPDDQLLAQLSDCELDVFYYLAEGAPIGRIKERLNITEKAVRNYKSRVTRKLGLGGVHSFAQYAAERGLAACN